MSSGGSWLRRANDALLVGPKALYFSVCVVVYILHLFRGQFIKDYLGLSQEQFGDISSAMAAVGFLFMTAWSNVADGLGRHRFVLALIMVASTLVFETAFFAKQIEVTLWRYIVVLIIFSVYFFFLCGSMPLVDYHVLKILSNRPGFSRDLYGRQRLWGTVSYGLTTLFVSVLTSHNKGSSGMELLFIAVPAAAALTVGVIYMVCAPDEPVKGGICALVGRKDKKVGDNDAEKDSEKEGEAKADATEETAEDAGEKSASQSGGVASKEESATAIDMGSKTDVAVIDSKKSQRRPIFVLLGNANFSFMLFVVFMTGTARAVMTTFLSPYWTGTMHFTKQQAAVAANTGLIFEVLIFFMSNTLLRTLGIYWLLIIAQTAMVLRCWAYVWLPQDASSFYVVMAVELLKGLAFGCAQTAGVKLAADCAPPGLEATAQALYTSVYSQLPAVLTGFIGGRMSADVLFLTTAWISTAALLLFLVKYFADGSIAIGKLSLRGWRSSA